MTSSDDDAEQLHYLMGRTVKPEDYPPDFKRAWDNMVAQCVADGVAVPTVYPGSVYEDCDNCGIMVAVGPRQQEQVARWNVHGQGYTVLCMICIAILSATFGEDQIEIVQLGNTFRRG